MSPHLTARVQKMVDLLAARKEKAEDLARTKASIRKKRTDGAVMTELMEALVMFNNLEVPLGPLSVWLDDDLVSPHECKVILGVRNCKSVLCVFFVRGVVPHTVLITEAANSTQFLTLEEACAQAVYTAEKFILGD